MGRSGREKRGEDAALRQRIARLEGELAHLRSPSGSDQYRALFENSSDAILIIKGDTFIDCNDATVRMLRYSDRDELLQTHPSELSPEYQPDGRPSFEKANEMMAIAFDQGSHRFEWAHMRADGSVVPVEVLLTVVPQDDGHILHVVWRDITERKRLEQELRHAQKLEAVGKLAGGIAHDFNNLLVAILGYTELLLDELESDWEWRPELTEIHRAATRAAKLTTQLLAFSRKQVLRPAVIDLDEALDEIERMLRRIIGEDVELVHLRAEQPTRVKVDPGQIDQVLLNLATNARDAMPEGGTLTLEVGEEDVPAGDPRKLPEGRYAKLEVRDTGVGIDDSTLPRIFDPFFTTKQMGEGTGLGLSTVYGIVSQSGGHVGVRSRKGEGTAFKVLLPLTDEEPTEPDTSLPRAAVGQGSAILVVEDEPAVAGLIRRVLVRHGYTVHEARNGRDALELIKNSDPEFDLLLTDVVMPIMGGPELVTRLRATRPGLPVLFMSGYTDNALARHGFDLGTVDLLRKPFSPARLLEAVQPSVAKPVNEG